MSLEARSSQRAPRTRRARSISPPKLSSKPLATRRDAHDHPPPLPARADEPRRLGRSKRVDALERALRPVAAVLVDVFFLRKRTERGEVGRVDLLAFLLEILDDVLLLTDEFRRVVVARFLGGRLEL